MQTRVRLLLLVALGLLVLAACGTPTDPPVAVEHEVSVTLAGDGQGTVTSDPAGIDTAAGQATATFVQNTLITLTAEPAEGSTFEGFDFDDPERACEDGSTETTCVITVSDAVDVTAIFALEVAPTDPVTLIVNVTGDGTVTSEPPGITGTINTFEFERGTEVTLTAVPAAGAEFVGWTPEELCPENGEENVCVLTLEADTTTVDAAFTDVEFEDDVVLDIDIVGEGSVTVDPSGVAGPDDTYIFERDTEVTLTAVPAAGWEFSSWSPAELCAENGDAEVCVLALTEDTTAITATFTEEEDPIIVDPVDVSVTIVGEGSVTSDPEGIDTAAGQTTAQFTEGDTITLTADPAGGWTFTGWTPEAVCPDGATVNPCVVTATEGLELTATFEELPVGTETLTVNVVAGDFTAGRVTSSPGDIDTTDSQSEVFDIGTPITLTAEPTAGDFAGWTGGVCPVPRSTVCTFTITEGQPEVTANFNLPIEVEFPILEETDNAEEFLGPSQLNPTRWPIGWARTDSSGLELGYEPAHEAPQAVGLRFPDITIPSDANVLNARIDFRTRAVGGVAGSGTPTLTIEGHNVADAPPFQGDLNLDPGPNDPGFTVTQRPRTDTSVTWMVEEAWGANQWRSSTNVADIVLELLEVDGWAAGNAMAFIIMPTDLSSTDFRRANAFIGTGPKPTLVVQYVPLP